MRLVMRVSTIAVAFVVLIVVAAVAVATSGRAGELPAAATKGGMSLEEVLAARRSVRRFASTPLTTQQIAQLCWAAQGVTEPNRGLRTCPSAGATYPLELYVVTAEGTSRYIPETHRLDPHRGGDLREALSQAALGQPCVRQAPAVFVIAAVVQRTAGKYGDRATRYVHMEVGHAGQNILLQAVALGLGAVPVGAYDDGAVAEALQLPDEQVPLYLIPVGVPG